MYVKKCSCDGEFPDYWKLEPDGLFYLDDNRGWIRITYNFIRVISRGRTPKGDGWSYTIIFETIDGVIDEVIVRAVDLSGSGRAGLKIMVNAGVEVCPGREGTFVAFIRECRLSQRDLLISSAGWVEGRNMYAFPNQVIGDTGGDRVVYRPEVNSPTESSMRPSGTLQEWRDHVASLAKGNPLLVFSTLTAFAAFLVRFLGLDGGGFNIVGPSSRGKTTFLGVGVSVASNGSDPATQGNSSIQRWSMTGNAAEVHGAAHNDGLLALDELGTFVGKGLDALLYNLTGGKGKAAMTSSRLLQKIRVWTCLILSTGELSFRAKLEETGCKIRAGQLIRMIDIPVGDEIILNTHGMAAGDFANRLKRACATYFGTAGPAFVAELIGYLEDDSEGFRRDLLEALEEFTVELTPAGLEPEQVRAIRRFALLRLAGELAVQFGILPLTDIDILEAVEFARDRWLQGSSNDISDNDRAIRALQGYITRNHSAFASIRDTHARVSNAKGFFNADRGWYLFDDAQLQTAISGYDVKEVVKALRGKRLLVVHESGRLKVKQRVACMGRPVRFYAVKACILEVNLDSGEVEPEAEQGLPGFETLDI